MPRTKQFEENKVLEKAMNLFWVRGFNATSAQDLVDELGLSRSSLYDTFGDKHQLFIRSLQYYREKMSGDLLEMINHSTNIETTSRQLFENIINDALSEKLSKGCMMFNSSIELAPFDAQIAAIVTGNTQDIEDALERLIKKGQQLGTFTKSIPGRSLARFLYNNIRGLRALVKTQEKDPKVFKDIVETTISILKN